MDIRGKLLTTQGMLLTGSSRAIVAIPHASLKRATPRRPRAVLRVAVPCVCLCPRPSVEDVRGYGGAVPRSRGICHVQRVAVTAVFETSVVGNAIAPPIGTHAHGTPRYMCPRPCTIAAILLHARCTDHTSRYLGGPLGTVFRDSLKMCVAKPQSPVAIVLHVHTVAAICHMNA